MRKTSATAYIIAAGLTKLSEMPRWKGYCSEEMVSFNRVFMRHGKDSLVKHLVSLLPPRVMTGVMDKLYVPGMTQHYLFRKRWIESHVSAGLDRGIRQVVLLGAGLDTLALRMAKPRATVRFMEIDLPKTQRAKLATLRREGYTFPGNCRFEAADLRKTPIASVLGADPHFDLAAPSMIVLEGVLMYLTEGEVEKLFSELGCLFTGSLKIVFGATAAPDGGGDLLRRVTRFLLSRGGERTKWHCSASAMPTFTGRLGFRIVATASYKTLQRLYRNEAEIARVPEHDEDYYVVARLAP